ncbi:MAG: hypothetical protein HQL66_04030 [Magnetococcales bacterium]|nr:hypothetical protein [Magnetococcales bacterium]
MGTQESKIADAVILLAKNLADPQSLLASLSPLERLRLSQGLGDAFNTLDRIDQAFADIEQHGQIRMRDDGIYVPFFDGEKHHQEQERAIDWS